MLDSVPHPLEEDEFLVIFELNLISFLSIQNKELKSYQTKELMNEGTF